MSDLSNYSENALLDHVYGNTAWTPPATIYMRLYSSNPDFETGSGGTELSTGGYSPIAITNNTTNFPNATNGSKTNGTVIATSAASASWSITGYGLWDASSSGNLLAGKSFGSPIAVASGEVFRFAIGGLTLQITGFSNYLNSKLIDLMFGAVSFSPASPLYFAYFTTAPSFSTGSGGTEASGGSYARASVTNNTTNFPSASGGAKSNGSAITWATPTADQGTIVAMGVYDASSAGNFYGGCAFATSKTATTGTPLSIAAGDFDITLA